MQPGKATQIQLDITSDLQKWRAFLAIAELGSLTRAALFLDSNQSLLSRHLNALERECKARLFNRNSLAVGALADVRVPTGDEENLLGSGAWGVRGLGIASWQLGGIAPHANFGYQWNGKSILAGDVRSGRKADLPDQQHAITTHHAEQAGRHISRNQR